MGNRRHLTDDEKADAARLKAAWLRAKNADKSMTQARVAYECGWSTQSAFSQFCNGDVPLNLEALLKLSKVLGVNPSDVSPLLSTQIPVASLPVGASELVNIYVACPGPEFKADILRYARLVLRDALAHQEASARSKA